MSNPENENNYDDNQEADDQRSQQDAQSDGFDALPPTDEERQATERNNLSQADKASEAAFTLEADRGIAPKKDE